MVLSRAVVVVSLMCVALSGVTACGDETEAGGDGGGDGRPAPGGAAGGQAGGVAAGGVETTGGADGAGGTPSPDAGAAPLQPVTLAFEAYAGELPFSCKLEFPALGTAGSTGHFLDFRLYVHDVRLTSGAMETPVALDQDGVWQLESVALLDFENKTGFCENGTEATNTTVRGLAPAGAYDGLRFKVGVPFDLNHRDVTTARSPLNLSGLFWNWQGGYKFMRIDTEIAGRDGPFNFHLGSTLCDGDPTMGGVTRCEYPNVVEVRLTGFDPLTQVARIDYAALVRDVDLSVNAGQQPGCMASPRDAECVPTFAALGLDLDTGAQDPDRQRVFTVAP